MFAGKQRRLENSPLVAESSTLMPTTGEDCCCRATNAVAGCELHETRRLGWWLAGPLPLPSQRWRSPAAHSLALPSLSRRNSSQRRISGEQRGSFLPLFRRWHATIVQGDRAGEASRKQPTGPTAPSPKPVASSPVSGSTGELSAATRWLQQEESPSSPLPFLARVAASIPPSLPFVFSVPWEYSRSSCSSSSRWALAVALPSVRQKRSSSAARSRLSPSPVRRTWWRVFHRHDVIAAATSHGDNEAYDGMRRPARSFSLPVAVMDGRRSNDDAESRGRRVHRRRSRKRDHPLTSSHVRREIEKVGELAACRRELHADADDRGGLLLPSYEHRRRL
nr:hypothetical protein Iba_chr12aCG10450 [Ipomoea batatas]